MFTCKSGKHTWLSRSDASKCCNGYARHCLVGESPAGPSNIQVLFEDVLAGYVWIPGPTLSYQLGQPPRLPYPEAEAASLCTGQIGHIQQPYLDITIKGATGLGTLLAPSWELVNGIKQQTLPPEAYQEQFLNLLRSRYRQRQADFLKLLTPGTTTNFACYCKPFDFCHRYLAIRVLQQIAERHSIPCQYKGELPTH